MKTIAYRLTYAVVFVWHVIERLVDHATGYHPITTHSGDKDAQADR